MKDVSLDQLPTLREHTDRVSQILRRKLDDYLETVRPLLAPQRVLGKHLSGTGGAGTPGAERAFKKLQERYATVAEGYGLSRELREGALELERNLQLHPWSYAHRLASGVAVAITSPVRWILTYRSAYAPDQLAQTLATRRDRRSADLLQFVLGALTLELLLETYPGVVRLLHDLRFEILIEPVHALGPVPLVSIRAAIPSFRPSDEILERSSKLSGVPAFIELIDTASTQLPDPLSAILRPEAASS